MAALRVVFESDALVVQVERWRGLPPPRWVVILGEYDRWVVLDRAQAGELAAALSESVMSEPEP